MALDCQLDSSTGEKKAKTKKEGEEDGVEEGKRPQRKERPPVKFVGCAEEWKRQNDKQAEKTGPDPWFTRKFAVGLVIGIFFYSYYVFVVRLCITMVQNKPNKLGGAAQGVTYLVVYHVLFLMFIWSYIKAITTPPGFAKDFVPKTQPPVIKEELVEIPGYNYDAHRPSSIRSLRSSQHGNVGQEEEEDADLPDDVEPPSRRGSTRSRRRIGEDDEEPSELGPVFNPLATIVPSSGPPATTTADSPSLDIENAERARTSQETDSTTAGTTSPPTHPSASGLTFVSPAPFSPHSKPASPSSFPASSSPTSSPQAPPPARRSASSSRSAAHQSFVHFPPPPPGWKAKTRPVVERIPPVKLVLTDEWRYDYDEGFLRPYRSHRCRHCAQVVLKMDHHCPWVGTCVGARNYKFFYNFLQWSTLYTLFLLISLLVAVIRPYTNPPPRPRLDPQFLAIIGISFLFTFFTLSLFLAHTRLILLNITTIEDMAMSRMNASERSRLHGALGWGWSSWKLKRRTRRAWEQEWGRIEKEGNIWWLGSGRKNWEMVMGKVKWGWFLPIDAKPHGDDGLSYIPNPRFSKEGVWRPRAEWPEELR